MQKFKSAPAVTESSSLAICSSRCTAGVFEASKFAAVLNAGVSGQKQAYAGGGNSQVVCAMTVYENRLSWSTETGASEAAACVLHGLTEVTRTPDGLCGTHCHS